MKADSELELSERRTKIGEILHQQPDLLRLLEPETLRELARNANARIDIGFEKHGSLVTSTVPRSDQPTDR